MTTAMHTKQRRGLGWIPDIPHLNDKRFRAPARSLVTVLPEEVVLPHTQILDQGATNSCTGHAASSLYRYMLRLLGKTEFQPSPLFIYYFGRRVPRLGWENEDMGAMPRDVMQTMISNGVVPETVWPFSEDPAKVNKHPPQDLLSNAKTNRIIEGKYVRMLATDNLYHLKYSLFQKLPFLIGVQVYSSFLDTGSDGMVSMPGMRETYEGGHLMYCTGYSDKLQKFFCPNSWGESAGDKGVFKLPYAYIANQGLASDFWRIEAIT